MLKKIRRSLALVCAFVMMFSMTAFAAENEGNLSATVKDQTTATYDGPATYGPAPAVSSVKIERAYVDANTGHVIVVVYIVGYGNNEIAKYDGVRVSMIDEDLITGTGRVVYAFRQYWDCGMATIGNHTFTFQTTSINPPRNTMYASDTIIVQQTVY